MRTIQIGKNDHTVGPDGAAITLVEYADFQCPFARRAVPIVEELRDRFPQQLRHVYRHFPLDHIHRDAFAAALASEAAAKQGAFWEMHGLLFRNQAELALSNLEEYAETLELDLDRFRRDMRAAAVRKKIEHDLETAGRLGVRSTPTFFVNGEIFEGSARDLPDVLARAGLGAGDDARP